MQEILSGLNIYNPSRGVHYGHVVAEQQVAIHFSSYKDMTDHTKAKRRAGYFPLLSNEHCMPDFNWWKKKNRHLLKKLPGFIISWIEKFVVATVCWRSEDCK